MTEFKGFRPTAWLKCAINAYHTSASSALSRFTPDVVFQKKKKDKQQDTLPLAATSDTFMHLHHVVF